MGQHAKGLVVAATVAVASLGLPVSALGSPGTLDQQCSPARASGGSEPIGTDFAQTFRAGASGPLEKASFQMDIFGGGPAQVQVAVKATDAGGHPAGPDLATSASASVSALFPGETVEFAFAAPPAVAAGQSYALLPNNTGTSFAWARRCEDGTYPNGAYLNYSGGSWYEVSSGEDLTFATYLGAPGSGGQQPPSGGQPPGGSTPPSITVAFPASERRYSRASVRRKFKAIRGKLSSAAGVSRVRVSLARRKGKRCQWLSRRKLTRGSCQKPVYLNARGVDSWKVGLSGRQRRALKPGRYTLGVQLQDAGGNEVSGSGTTTLGFSIG